MFAKLFQKLTIQVSSFLDFDMHSDFFLSLKAIESQNVLAWRDSGGLYSYSKGNQGSDRLNDYLGSNHKLWGSL